MELEAGTRLASTVCATEVVVVRPPDGPVELTCGGHPMVPSEQAPEPTGGPAAERAEGTQMGKRYQAAAAGLEVLCTRAGAGSLALDGEPLGVKEPKAVPSSD